jgi:peptidoglycan lytic transglycosylase
MGREAVLDAIFPDFSTDLRLMNRRGGGKWLEGARFVPCAAAIAACLVLTNCASSDKFARKVDPKYGVASSPRVVDAGQPVPKGGGTYRVGKAYTVAGRSYIPETNEDYSAEGMASWYGDDFHGRLTANGEVFDMHAITAAHPTLPIPSYARVTNLANTRSIIVRINDRGPYHGNRVIDLSHKTADLLGFKGNGVARVRVDYVGRASLDGSDDRKLVATLRQGEPAPAPSAVRVASARPFVDLADNNAGPIRGAVPSPSERPYSLGQDAAQPPVRRGATDLTAARISPRGGEFTTPASIVSAYAAVPPAPAAFVSGRGLY